MVFRFCFRIVFINNAMSHYYEFCPVYRLFVVRINVLPKSIAAAPYKNTSSIKDLRSHIAWVNYII